MGEESEDEITKSLPGDAGLPVAQTCLGQCLYAGLNLESCLWGPPLGPISGPYESPLRGPLGVPIGGPLRVPIGAPTAGDL